VSLINCEDCGKEISDLAPACIHCGRPQSLAVTASEVGDDASERWKEFREKGRKVLEQSGSLARSVGASVRDGAVDAAAAGGRLSELSLAALDRLIDRRTVEVLALPTGSGAGDVYVHVDIGETLLDLHSGILVRPEFSVWSHRSDVDRTRLASLLEQAFSAQVTAFRERSQAKIDATKSKALTTAEEQGKSAGKSGRKAARVAIAAGFAMLIVTNPLLDLLLLGLAVTKGAGALLDTLRALGAEVDAEQAEKGHQAETDRVSATVRAKRKSFRLALERLDVKVHPGLAELASDYAALDDIPLNPEQVATGLVPDVGSVLRGQTYLSALPSWYYPLLEARHEIWRTPSP